jgi:hypothetical protein
MYSTLVRVVPFGCEATVLHDELKGPAHVSAGAADGLGVAVHQLLLRQGHQLPVLDLVDALDGRNGRERPARTCRTRKVSPKQASHPPFFRSLFTDATTHHTPPGSSPARQLLSLANPRFSVVQNNLDPVHCQSVTSTNIMGNYELRNFQRLQSLIAVMLLLPTMQAHSFREREYKHKPRCLASWCARFCREAAVRSPASWP